MTHAITRTTETGRKVVETRIEERSTLHVFEADGTTETTFAVAVAEVWSLTQESRALNLLFAGVQITN